MHSLNQITLIGRVVGKIFYINTEPSAADLVRFTVLTEIPSDFQEAPQQQQHECIAWGPIGLQLHQHLNTGSELAVRGALKYHQFRQKNGRRRKLPEIHVSQFTFLGN